ncbi:MAG: metal-dependent transcriptional regulator, partial [Planctomycetota bacterium]|nr:metal-dependent transcriptional regulator [Planctomycetota bacterium]
MPSLTVENYLKAILQIGLRESAEWVSAGQVAQALGVSPGTVTSMHKTLGEADLVV